MQATRLWLDRGWLVVARGYGALVAVGLALGCSDRGNEVSEFVPADLGLWAPEPARTLAVDSRTDLSALFPADAQLAGVAVNPYDREHQYILEATRGIYKVGPEGAELVFSLPDATVAGGEGNGLPPAELTDIAILRTSPDRVEFALTAENEGYSLTLGSAILRSYFCYLPQTAQPPSANGRPSISEQLRADGVAIKERTNAVAVNSSSGQIFAQPRTFRLDRGTVAGSEFFVFDAGGGQPVFTRVFDSRYFVAGGMAVVSDTLLFGHGGDLYQLSAPDAISAERLGKVAGVVSIDGLDAADGGWNALFVLDGANKQLLKVTFAELFENR